MTNRDHIINSFNDKIYDPQETRLHFKVTISPILPTVLATDGKETNTQ